MGKPKSISPAEDHRRAAASNQALGQLVKNCPHNLKDEESASIDGWDVVRCTGCGLVLRQPSSRRVCTPYSAQTAEYGVRQITYC